jgi:hypothetical protein
MPRINPELKDVKIVVLDNVDGRVFALNPPPPSRRMSYGIIQAADLVVTTDGRILKNRFGDCTPAPTLRAWLTYRINKWRAR